MCVCASSVVVSHSSPKTGLEWGTQHLVAGLGKQQVPPLRFAPVPRQAGTGGMANWGGAFPVKIC